MADLGVVPFLIEQDLGFGAIELARASGAFFCALFAGQPVAVLLFGKQAIQIWT